MDAVRAERLRGGGRTAAWTEIEVELADGGDPALLDAVEKRLRKAGVRPVRLAPSKLAAGAGRDRAAEPGSRDQPAGTDAAGAAAPPATTSSPTCAPRSTRSSSSTPPCAATCPTPCTSMRVATRRLRSAFRSYRKVLDRDVTDPSATS